MTLTPPEQTVLLLTTAKKTLKTDLVTGTYRRYQELARTGKTFGFRLVAAFPEDISVKTRTFTARSFTEKVPYAVIGREKLPPVIYNRISTRSDERRYAPLLKALRKLPSVTVFNPGFFNKWMLLGALKASPSWPFKLPESGRLNAQMPDGLDALFSRIEGDENKVVYLKPIHGHAGLGILTIEPIEGPPQPAPTERATYRADETFITPCRYRLTLQTASGLKRTRIEHQEALASFIHALSRREPYMWQKRVPRPKPPGPSNLGAVDIRTLMQKKSDGRWQLTGWALRAAPPDGITTHVPHGGFRPPRLQTLKRLYPDLDLEQFLKRLKSASHIAARTIDAHYGRTLGELSLDFALGKEGSLWFLEANSKPMRFDERRIEVAWRRTFWETVTYFMSRTGVHIGV